MSDQLLPLYDQELAYLRTLAGEFADAHPKIAGRLRLSPDAVDDPHVARMIEAFALVAARIRQKLDDEFPELTGSLLGALYPHLLAPFPSMAIARFAPVPELDGSYVVPRHTALEMEPIDGEACRYRTAQAVELWPVAVRTASISTRPLVAPPGPFTDKAVSCLRVVLDCLSPQQSFGVLGHGPAALLPGRPAAARDRLARAAVQRPGGRGGGGPPGRPRRGVPGPRSLQPAGFAPEEALLPHSPRTFAGYRLLGEYFGFPAKFMFVDLSGISAKTLRGGGSSLELFFYFDRAAPGLERHVGADNVVLGCTPIVNLFPQRAEPVALTHEAREYLVRAGRPPPRDARGVRRRPRDASARPGGRSAPVLPFFASHHAADPARADPVLDQPAPPPGRSATTAPMSPCRSWTPSSAPRSPTDGDPGGRDHLPQPRPAAAHALRRQPPGAVAWWTGRPRSPPCAASRRPPPRCGPRGRRGGLAADLAAVAEPPVAERMARRRRRAARDPAPARPARRAGNPRRASKRSAASRAARGTARLPGSGAICRGVDVDLELDAAAAGRQRRLPVRQRAGAVPRAVRSINSFSRLTVRLHGRAEPFCRFPAAGRRAAAAVNSRDLPRLTACRRSRTGSTACRRCAWPSSARRAAGRRAAGRPDGGRGAARPGLRRRAGRVRARRCKWHTGAHGLPGPDRAARRAAAGLQRDWCRRPRGCATAPFAPSWTCSTSA